MQGTKKFTIVLLLVCMQTSHAFSFFNQNARYEDEESSLGLWGSLSFVWWGAKQVYALQKYIGGGSLLYMLAPVCAVGTLMASSCSSRPKNTYASPFARPLYFSKLGKKKNNNNALFAQQQQLLLGGLLVLSGFGFYKLTS